ncbi:MAG: hypothetical protein JO013_01500 [Alphaproteobacteria bacterium]|nr:hypothetical protein [Alphaproteobacteria bacterium]
MRLRDLTACLAVAALAVAAAPPPKARRISDAELVRYAASKFDARKWMFQREVVGLHRGTLVVADYHCGDVCPHYTRRIIHYDVTPADCARVGGVVASELVVRGIGVRKLEICKPAVLAKAVSAR